MTSHEISPLRYPGGKGGLAPFLGRLLSSQSRPCRVYVEPYAGGAGVALRLLCDEYVDEVVLNDLDAGVAAFWRSVFRRTEELAQLIEHAQVTVDAWHAQRAIYTSRGGQLDDLELGFATFFLNRTNRSGILNARPIGGLGQTGPWKIDARYNGTRLAERVRAQRFLTDDHFIYADPPYLVRGSDLYLDTLTWSDHQQLAKKLTASTGRWMVTYDHDPRVHELYPHERRAEFVIAHTAAKPHVGRELAVFADALQVADLAGLGRDGRFVS